jgi:hypothetical protein
LFLRGWSLIIFEYTLFEFTILDSWNSSEFFWNLVELSGFHEFLRNFSGFLGFFLKFQFDEKIQSISPRPSEFTCKVQTPRSALK